MFIILRVLVGAAAGTAGAAVVWAGMWLAGIFPALLWSGVGLAWDEGVPFCGALGFFGALLGILFAGRAGSRGRWRGAVADGTLGITLTLLFGPIGIAGWVLPLGIAGGVAASVFPREDHGTA